MRSPFVWTRQHADLLSEVGNIGAGHAATALSELLQQPVRVSLSNARLCPFAEIAEVVGGPEALIVGVLIRVSGDLGGHILLILPPASARSLVAAVLPVESLGDEFTELSVSALAEIGNILCGAYLTAVSELTLRRFVPSVPAVACDMALSVLDVSLLPAGEVSDDVILVDTQVETEQSALKEPCLLLLLPDPQSFQALTEGLFP
ncbi:MAG: chemotaxis protein CheC [Alicyclobacillus sp.]|nr:chemotaxis protein CheC [Alicyclobacillus sp.]